MKKPFAFFVIVTGLAATAAYLQAPRPLNSRGPASVGDSLPVLMVCSGGADVPNVFSFSGKGDGLRVVFDGVKNNVMGPAQIALRGRDSAPVFEDTVQVTGTRTPDGRTYNLSGRKGKEHFSIELVYNGTGTVQRTVDGAAESERFEAHCQIEPQVN